MFLLLLLALLSLLGAGALAFLLPCTHHQRLQRLHAQHITVGARVRTHTGAIGTVHSIGPYSLVLFFDDGERATLHRGQIAAVLESPHGQA